VRDVWRGGARAAAPPALPHACGCCAPGTGGVGGRPHAASPWRDLDRDRDFDRDLDRDFDRDLDRDLDRDSDFDVDFDVDFDRDRDSDFDVDFDRDRDRDFDFDLHLDLDREPSGGRGRCGCGSRRGADERRGLPGLGRGAPPGSPVRA
jgi:hypothetical protein